MNGELPLVADVAAPRERADAARNRRRILQEARRLIAEDGGEKLCMDEVARRAGVGTGTLYRRFGDRAGLALALLDERERAFQDELLRGPAPLGPGAPPRERLHAFGRAYIELVEEHLELLSAVAPRGVPAGGPFDVYLTHIHLLLEEAGLRRELDYAAATLMTMLSPIVHRHLRTERGWSVERLQAGFRALIDAWLGEPARDR